MLFTSWLGQLTEGAVPMLGILLWVCTGVGMGYWAHKKHRSPWFWGVFGGLFWGAGVVCLYFLKDGREASLASRLAGWFLKRALFRIFR